MAHEAEIIVPGSFVVLQGIPGDGLSNSIDSAPIFPYDDVAEHDIISGGGQAATAAGLSNHNDVDDSPSTGTNATRDESTTAAAAPVPTTPTRAPGRETTTTTTHQLHSSMMSSTYNSLLPPNSPLNSPLRTPIVHPIENEPEESFVLVSEDTTMEHRHGSTTTSPSPATSPQPNQQEEISTFSTSRVQQLSSVNQNAILDWEMDCRNREVRQRKDWCTLDASLTYHAAEEEEMWWQIEGLLAIFDEVPYKQQKQNEDDVVERNVVGKLAPGSTVVGVELLCLDAKTLKRIEKSTKASSSGTNATGPTNGSRNNGSTTNGNQPQSSRANATTSKTNNMNTNVYPRGKKGIVQLLKIESPNVGYVVLSVDGYAFLGPGLPLTYADPEVWVWRVTCPDGAYVREGLELTSHHIETVPFGSFLRVSRKTVNSMGLSRLRVHALLEEDDDVTTNASGSSASNKYGNTNNRRVVEGWISEALNPLSGQRGPIVQPLPFPVPVVYRVALPAGAIVRSDVELSSTQIGHAPMGSELSIVGRAFSEHPMDQCIERLQLAGHGGWVSVRLNRPPPLDELVFELLGIDGNFDPSSPGLYHLDAYQKVVQEHNNQEVEELLHLHEEGNDVVHDLSDIGGNYARRSSIVSSINEEDDDDNDNDGINSSSSSPSASPRGGGGGGGAIPTLFRSGFAGAANIRGGSVASGSSVGGGGSRGKPPYSADEHCLICLTEERNATIVHGETGHIACCLICARILKARGDKCPVCRLPIDSVIQQFWA